MAIKDEVPGNHEFAVVGVLVSVVDANFHQAVGVEGQVTVDRDWRRTIDRSNFRLADEIFIESASPYQVTLSCFSNCIRQQGTVG